VPDTTDSLSTRLVNEGEKTFDFFASLSNEQLERTVYSEGACWNVRQILAHFVSAEMAFLELLSDVLAGGMGAPEGFDIDTFNQKKVATLQDASVSDLLDQFRELRQQTSSTVSQIGPETLERTARHPFLGIAPLVAIIKLIYRHNQIHLRDVRRIIEEK
jgi:uncharacterized damage-inducible protein DinB